VGLRERERGREKKLFLMVEVLHVRIFSIMIYVNKYHEERERERAGKRVCETDVCAYIFTERAGGR